MENSTLRLIIFFLTLILLAILETYFSYRKRNLRRKDRWLGNIGLIAISNIIIKALLPLGLIPFAIYFQEKSLGVFNLININIYLEILFSFILLDGIIYFQHVLFHKIPFLWKIHRVHHADTDLDVTSALRFHPLEILISISYKLIFIFFLGIGPVAIVLFEIILSSMAMFNHSNLYLPKKLEGFMRLFIVTPQMHIIHHSVDRKESDMNYGFNLSIWDRIFKTYQKEFLIEGKIGLSYYRTKKEHEFKKILLLPFKNIISKRK